MRQINFSDESFCSEIGRLMSGDYTFGNIRGKKSKIYHLGNVALVFNPQDTFLYMSITNLFPVECIPKSFTEGIGFEI